MKKVAPDEIKRTVKRVLPSQIVPPAAGKAGETPATNGEIFTPEEMTLGRIMKNNPEKSAIISDLIERFNLVSTMTGKPLKVPPAANLQTDEQPAPAAVIPAVAQPKKTLEEIAAETFDQGRAYTDKEATSAIMSAHGITEARAAAGLAAMEKAGILERAGSGLFLWGSTPF